MLLAISKPGESFYDTLSRYSTTAVPLFLAKSVTVFYPNEPIINRVFEGVLFAGHAAIIECLINSGYINNYSWDALPVVFSLAQKNAPVPQNYKLLTSIIITVSTEVLLLTDSWSYLIAPAITYSVTARSLPQEQAIALTMLVVAEEGIIALDVMDNHYAAFSAAGGVISHSYLHNNIPVKMQLVKPEWVISTGVGAIPGLIAAYNEQSLIDMFTPKKIFSDSYEVLGKLIGTEELNHQIERAFIAKASLYLSVGIYGNYHITNGQALDNFRTMVAQPGAPEFNQLKERSLKYVKIASLYAIDRVLSEVINSCIVSINVKFVQNRLLEEQMLTKQNFITVAKSNFTVTDYLDDVSIVTQNIEDMTQEFVFALPKLSMMTVANKPVFLSLLGVIGIDILYSSVMEYIAKKQQQFYDDAKLCASNLDEITKHDSKNANLVLQSDALEFVEKKWIELNNCVKENNAWGDALHNFHFYVRWLYTENALNIALKYLAAHLVYIGSIQPEELFLLVRGEQSMTDVILFNTKHSSDYKKINSSINKLNSLAETLKAQASKTYGVKYQLEENQNAIKILDLHFSRGNAEKNVTWEIKNITLEMGSVYAVTGDNGSGKSSLLTFLFYVAKNIYDSSYNANQGTITYPSNNIKMISQKDYCPFNVTLGEVISHKQFDKEMALQLIKDFKVNFVYELKERHKDWCDQTKLSGGQIKKLFMVGALSECPSILILDEAFGPIDTEAKKIIMDKIKGDSCLSKSLVLVVSHDEFSTIEFCKSNTFYDKELHIENGAATVKDLCKAELEKNSAGVAEELSFCENNNVLYASHYCGLNNMEV